MRRAGLSLLDARRPAHHHRQGGSVDPFFVEDGMGEDEVFQITRTQTILTLVPEPSTALLVGVGLLGLAALKPRSQLL